MSLDQPKGRFRVSRLQYYMPIMFECPPHHAAHGGFIVDDESGPGWWTADRWASSRRGGLAHRQPRSEDQDIGNANIRHPRMRRKHTGAAWGRRDVEGTVRSALMGACSLQLGVDESGVSQKLVPDRYAV
jgi:hypothetical protein